jgi:thioredoxin 1
MTYQNRIWIFEINIDEQCTLAVDYGVQRIPTLIIFEDGKEIRRFVGLQSETVIKKGLDEILLPLNTLTKRRAKNGQMHSSS